jgi:branched-chain amino acid aminotransferase
MHRYLLHNNEVHQADTAALSPGQVGLLSGWGVFSTIRIYEGVMFQWERHWQRMKRDAERMRVPFPSEPRWIEEGLYRLVDANGAVNATLRVVIVRNQGGLWEGAGQRREFDVLGLTANVISWPAAVKLGTIPHGRHAASEFAGTKYLSWAENLTRYERAHVDGFDEVILLNERGEVAECTSANIFIVNGGTSGKNVINIFTPPLSAGCLPGVTRALLLEEIRVAGIEISEQTLMPEMLDAADEVFITSTTRELLPVSQIDGRNRSGANPVCKRLREAFKNLTVDYAAAHARKPAYDIG